MVKQRGFTLVEVMIAVAIIGILATIAYPSYQEYIRKTKRGEAQTEMMAVASALQRYKIANFTFMNGANAVSLADLGSSGQSPATGDALYTFSLSDVTANTWTLTATPVSGKTQQNDGVIMLNYRNERCWDKGQSSCTLSATSNWDGK